jgi:hypothetical protein
LSTSCYGSEAIFGENFWQFGFLPVTTTTTSEDFATMTSSNNSNTSNDSARVQKGAAKTPAKKSSTSTLRVEAIPSIELTPRTSTSTTLMHDQAIALAAEVEQEEVTPLFAQAKKSASIAITRKRLRLPQTDSAVVRIDTKEFDSAFKHLLQVVEGPLSRQDIPRFLMQLESRVKTRGLDRATSEKLLIELVASKASTYVDDGEDYFYDDIRDRLLARYHGNPLQHVQSEMLTLLQDPKPTPQHYLDAFTTFRRLIGVYAYIAAVLNQPSLSSELICDYTVKLMPASYRQSTRHAFRRGDYSNIVEVLNHVECDLEDHRSDNHSSPTRTVAYIDTEQEQETADQSRFVFATQTTPAVRCEFCGKSGTFARVCSCPQASASRSQVLSIPNNVNPNSQPLRGNNQRVYGSCYSCGEVGHMRNQCPQRQQNSTSTTRAAPYGNPNNTPVSNHACMFCGANHISRMCSKNPARPNAESFCAYCHRRGHTEMICRQKANDLVMFNQNKNAADNKINNISSGNE